MTANSRRDSRRNTYKHQAEGSYARDVILASLVDRIGVNCGHDMTTLGDLLVARKIMTKKVNTTAGQLPYTYTALASHDFYGTVYDTANSVCTMPRQQVTTRLRRRRGYLLTTTWFHGQWIRLM